MQNIHETESLFYEMEGDLLIATYKKGVRHVNRAMAEEIVADRLAFQGGKPVHLLIQEMGGADFSKEARAYFASENGIEGLLSIAILAKNWITYGTASFILSIQRPRVPTRIFRDRKDAMEWLKKQMAIARGVEKALR